MSRHEQCRNKSRRRHGTEEGFHENFDHWSKRPIKEKREGRAVLTLTLETSSRLRPQRLSPPIRGGPFVVEVSSTVDAPTPLTSHTHRDRTPVTYSPPIETNLHWIVKGNESRVYPYNPSSLFRCTGDTVCLTEVLSGLEKIRGQGQEWGSERFRVW